MAFLKKNPLIFLFIGLLLGLLLFLPDLVSLYSQISETVTGKIEEELAKLWAARIQIGGVSLSFPTFDLLGLEIYTYDDRPVLKAEKVRVHLRWAVLLFQRPLADALQWLEFIEPVLWLDTTEKGGLRFPDLSRGKDGDPAPLPGIILKITGGTLRITGDGPWPWGEFTDIYGLVDLRKDPLIMGTLNFTSLLDPEAKARLVLEYCREKRAAYYEISSVNASAPVWGEKVNARFALFPDLRLLDGKTDFSFRLLSNPDGTVADYVRVRLEEAELTWDKLSSPLKQVTTEFIARPEEIEIKEFNGGYREGRVSFSGRIRPGEEPSYDLQIAGEQLAIADWTSLFPDLAAWDLSGKAGLRLRLHGQGDLPALQGEITLAGAGLRVPGDGRRLEDLDLSARITGEELRIAAAKGRFDGTRFQVQGSVFLREEPQLELAVSFRGLQPEDYFPAEWAVSAGEADGRLYLKGRWPEPVVSGEVFCSVFRWDGLEAQNLRLTGEYHPAADEFRIANFTFDTLSGRAWMTGTVAALREEAVVNLDVGGHGLDLGGLPLDRLFFREMPPVGGCGDFQATLSGPLSRLQGEGELTVEDGKLDRMAFSRIRGRFSWDGARLYSGLTLHEADGRLVLTGWWEPGSGDYQADLLVSHLDFPVEQLIPEFPGIRGKVSAVVNMEKNETPLNGAGRVEVYDLRTRDGSVLPGQVILRGTIDDTRVRIADSFLLLNGGRLALEGEVSWEGEPAYTLRARSSGLSLASLVSFWPVEDWPVVPEGQADLEITVNGGAQPRVAGKIEVDGLFLQDHFVEHGTVNFRWEEGTFYLTEARLWREEEKVTVSGAVKEGVLDLQALVEGFSLATLGIPVYGRELSGRLYLEGGIKGTFASPSFAGLLHIDGVNLGGVFLDQVAGEVKWEEMVLFLEAVRVVRGEQELEAYGQIDLTGDPGLDLGLRMEKTELSELLLLLGISPAVPVEGKVTGYFRVLGPMDGPQVRVIARVEEGRLDKEDVTGEFDLQMQNSTVTINRLRLEDREGEFLASGSYTPGRQFSGKMEIRDFTLAPLAALAGLPDLTSGRVHLQLAAETTRQGLAGDFSGRLQEVVWRGITFPEVAFSGRLEESVVYLTAQETENNRVMVHGRIPLVPGWFNGALTPVLIRSQGEEIDLRFTMEAAEATFFNAFFPRPVFTGGTVDGAVTLKGPADAVYLEGKLEAKGLGGTVPGLPAPFRGVNGEITFSRGQLLLEGWRGRYGDGRFRAGGSISLQGLQPGEFNLQLSGENLHYTSPFFDGWLGGTCLLTGPVESPLLKGDVLIEKTRLSLASLSGAPPEWALRLDLNLRFGSDVYFRQYGLASIPLRGSLHVGGTLPHPELNGEFVAGRGWISVYGDTFRVKQARAEFRPEYGLLPYLELEAAFFLTGTEIILSTQGWTGDDVLFNLSSNPPRSREEIFSLLNWSGRLQETENLTLAYLLEGNIAVVTDTILGPLFDQFRDLFQVDFLSLEPDRDFGGLRMNIGKALTRDLYLSYSRNLTALAEEIWTMEGRLSPNLSLLGEYSTEQGWEWQLFYNIWF